MGRGLVRNDVNVVMQNAEIVQMAMPVDLFERPAHTFVGHFSGPPGMNVLACEIKSGRAMIDGHAVEQGPITPGEGRIEIGVRPVFVQVVASGGIPAQVRKVRDVGRHSIL